MKKTLPKPGASTLTGSTTVPSGSLERRLLLSSLSIAGAGVLILCIALGVSLWFGSTVQRFATLRSPTAEASLVAGSNLQKTFAALKGWALLGEGQFKTQRKAAWAEIHAALEKLDHLSLDWKDKDARGRLKALKKLLFDLEIEQWWIEDVARTTGNEPARVIFDHNIYPIALAAFDALTKLAHSEQEKEGGPERKRLLVAMADMRAMFTFSLANIEEYLAHVKPEHKTQFKEHLRISWESMAYLKNRQPLLDDEQQRLLLEISRNLTAFEHFSYEGIKVRELENWNIANYWMSTQAGPQIKAVTTLLETMSTKQRRLMHEDAALINRMGTFLIAILSLSIVGMVGLAIVLSRRNANRIAQPIAALSRAAERMSQGNLDSEEIPVTSADEVGHLTQAFNQMKRALGESWAQLEGQKTALDQFAIVAETDARGRITYVNDQFCKVAKFTREELLGQDHRIINSGHHPKSFFKEMWNTIRQGKVWRNEIKNRSKDGSIYWVDTAIIALMDEKDKPEKYLAIRAVITDRKIAEEELNLRAKEEQMLHYVAALATEKDTFEELLTKVLSIICETTRWPIGHVYLRSDYDKELLNPTALWFFENRSRYQNFQEITENTTFRRGIGLPGRILESRKPAWIVNVQKDPNFPRAKLCSDVKVKGAFGLPIMVGGHVAVVMEFFAEEEMQPNPNLLLTMKNVSDQLSSVLELRNAQAEIVMTNNKLAAANQELKDFAYIVSHDLKAPLRGIGSLSDMLELDYSDRLDDDGREQLRLLRSRVVRMSNLINGILDYSRLGRVGDEITEVDLQPLLRETIDLLNAPDNMKIEIVKSMPKLFCDRVRIGQVFQNLMSNALKYIDKPEGEIKIDYREEGKDYVFSVQDNGPGIDEKYHKKIFEIFQTLQKRDSSESTGIGLSTVKKIVERHNGKIWVESKQNVGTTFLFTLPRIVT